MTLCFTSRKLWRIMLRAAGPIVGLIYRYYIMYETTIKFQFSFLIQKRVLYYSLTQRSLPTSWGTWTSPERIGKRAKIFILKGLELFKWLACVNAGQPVISPGASPARQAQNWLRPAHEMGSSPHTVRARKIYPPKFYLSLHPVYCVAANMDAVNHVSSRRAGQARSGQDRARSA